MVTGTSQTWYITNIFRKVNENKKNEDSGRAQNSNNYIQNEQIKTSLLFVQSVGGLSIKYYMNISGDYCRPNRRLLYSIHSINIHPTH